MTCPSPIQTDTSFLGVFVQVVKALEVLYELFRSSPPREQVQAVLLEWGVEQLYSLLLNPSFGDRAREMVFRVRVVLFFHSFFLFFLSVSSHSCLFSL